ncbi:hypothetical protein RA280_19730 [Cupriavidus sp. CV2]|uniref:hypothetical protein n=1 Tax=Cupriavidus ulmosensis TaxID=3065913 RepID=UPI00296AF14B|nr:hypothetical protein [Cupriavidus sp. CV2]MDW3683934.1 hypothetical protein [Cupriavidus sp. CV2]
MKANLEAIKAAAMAVTPGPWEAYGTIVRDIDGGEDQLAEGCDATHARYIAAVDPEVVLELVARLEQAEALLRDIVAHPDKPLAGTEFEGRLAVAGAWGL